MIRSVHLGNQPVVAPQAPLGAHAYTLHVYDGKLGSGQSRQNVKVVDTTPPKLTVAPADLCLWPPNHNFLLLRLGQELKVDASDACDPNPPTVRILFVRSNEGVNVFGSGHTSLDFSYGPTAACVRAERAGLGEGRHYTVTVEAKDSSGNATTQDVTAFVPHDDRQHPGCVHATGMEVPDQRCGQ